STSSLNMRRLRSLFIGSIRAWLPSRRSTEHQIGGAVMARVGHRRSGRSMGRTGVYLVAGFTRGRLLAGFMVVILARRGGAPLSWGLAPGGCLACGVARGRLRPLCCLRGAAAASKSQARLFEKGCKRSAQTAADGPETVE